MSKQGAYVMALTTTPKADNTTIKKFHTTLAGISKSTKCRTLPKDVEHFKCAQMMGNIWHLMFIALWTVNFLYIRAMSERSKRYKISNEESWSTATTLILQHCLVFKLISMKKLAAIKKILISFVDVESPTSCVLQLSHFFLGVLLPFCSPLDHWVCIQGQDRKLDLKLTYSRKSQQENRTKVPNQSIPLFRLAFVYFKSVLPISIKKGSVWVLESRKKIYVAKEECRTVVKVPQSQTGVVYKFLNHNPPLAKTMLHKNRKADMSYTYFSIEQDGSVLSIYTKISLNTRTNLKDQPHIFVLRTNLKNMVDKQKVKV
ncbi:hypothetical protein BY458DRAFT_490903 [Sporodiniella umbellata]|nr:hypothetical protein BY458DRAFT_490903 [Sporodiniella umbellata]